MIHNEYYKNNLLDNNDLIDPSCCDQFGYLETMIWVEQKHQSLIESCIQSDIKEIIYKECSDLSSISLEEWCSDKIDEFAKFIYTIVDKTISLIIATFAKNKYSLEIGDINDKIIYDILKEKDIGTVTFEHLSSIDYIDNISISNDLKDIINLSMDSMNKYATDMIDSFISNYETKPQFIKYNDLNMDYINKKIYTLRSVIESCMKPIRLSKNEVIEILNCKKLEDKYNKISTNYEPLYNIININRNKTINIIDKFKNCKFEDNIYIKNELIKFINNIESIYVEILSLINCAMFYVNTSRQNKIDAAKLYLSRTIKENINISNESYKLLSEIINYDII